MPFCAKAGEKWETLFTGVLGLLVALVLAKLGNPVILGDKIPAPRNLQEFLIQPWPLEWGYGLLLIVALLATRVWSWKVIAPKWILILPTMWFAWQGIAAIQTVNGALTWATLKQFLACAVCFYLGLFALGRAENLRLFWLGVVGGFLVVMAVGWEQHFGGLQRTREYFFGLPDWKSFPPEFLKKVASNRIYGTLFYPNALAGVVILLLPAVWFGLWQWTGGMPSAFRVSVSSATGMLALGCLYWSGSKAGWLIVLGQALVAFLNCPAGKRTKLLVASVVIIVGLGGFAVKYRDYFARGATSTTARFDYWRAAGQTLRSNPLLGTGPGTFMVNYQRLKAPESEMARLAHNDFLQQGSDSGLPGLILYAAWIWGSVCLLYRRIQSRWLAVPWAVWLGIAGFACHSVVEFGLYIPALAWPFFLFLGWLWSQPVSAKPVDKAGAAQ